MAMALASLAIFSLPVAADGPASYSIADLARVLEILKTLDATAVPSSDPAAKASTTFITSTTPAP
jgi:hypothetical protein